MSDAQGPVYSDLADDPDFRELLVLFVESAAEKRDALRTASEAGRYDDLKAEAHRLKGAAAGYGFSELSTLAARLEQVCREGADRGRIESAVSDVLDHLARLRVAP